VYYIDLLIYELDGFQDSPIPHGPTTQDTFL
jgi:hypothetical protein